LASSSSFDGLGGPARSSVAAGFRRINGFFGVGVFELELVRSKLRYGRWVRAVLDPDVPRFSWRGDYPVPRTVFEPVSSSRFVL
jgi:hypothetical protein